MFDFEEILNLPFVDHAAASLTYTRHIWHQIEKDPDINAHRKKPHSNAIPIENETTGLRIAPSHPNEAVRIRQIADQREDKGKEAEGVVSIVERVQDTVESI